MAHILPNKGSYLHGKYFFQMVVFKNKTQQSSSLLWFGLLKLVWFLLQSFSAQPSESWTMEEDAVGSGKELEVTFVVNVLCNLGQATESLMIRMPFMLDFWGVDRYQTTALWSLSWSVGCEKRLKKLCCFQLHQPTLCSGELQVWPKRLDGFTSILELTGQKLW